MLRWRYSSTVMARRFAWKAAPPRVYSGGRRLISPKINDTKKRTIKIKKRTLAISVAVAAIPPNPKIAATMATIKKVKAQLSIENLL
jgi:hypothetical protein